MDIKVKVSGDVLDISTLKRRGKSKLLPTAAVKLSRKAITADPQVAVDFLVGAGASKPRNAS